MRRQKTQFEELESRLAASEAKVAKLGEQLIKKDDEKKASEERYKHYLNKAKNVIQSLDPKQNAGVVPELRALQSQIQQRDRLIEHLQKDLDKAKNIQEREEKPMVTAWENLKEDKEESECSPKFADRINDFHPIQNKYCQWLAWKDSTCALLEVQSSSGDQSSAEQSQPKYHLPHSVIHLRRDIAGQLTDRDRWYMTQPMGVEACRCDCMVYSLWGPTAADPSQPNQSQPKQFHNEDVVKNMHKNLDELSNLRYVSLNCWRIDNSILTGKLSKKLAEPFQMNFNKGSAKAFASVFFDEVLKAVSTHLNSSGTETTLDIRNTIVLNGWASFPVGYVDDTTSVDENSKIVFKELVADAVVYQLDTCHLKWLFLCECKSGKDINGLGGKTQALQYAVVALNTQPRVFSVIITNVHMKLYEVTKRDHIEYRKVAHCFYKNEDKTFDTDGLKIFFDTCVAAAISMKDIVCKATPWRKANPPSPPSKRDQELTPQHQPLHKKKEKMRTIDL